MHFFLSLSDFNGFAFVGDHWTTSRRANEFAFICSLNYFTLQLSFGGRSSWMNISSPIHLNPSKIHLSVRPQLCNANLRGRNLAHVQLVAGHGADSQWEAAGEGDNDYLFYILLHIFMKCIHIWCVWYICICHMILFISDNCDIFSYFFQVAFVGHNLDEVIGQLEASASKYLVQETFK